MTLPIHGDPPPLCETENGVILISGTRISLERVVRAFCLGATPEQIAQDFDVLTIEAVYAVVNYYLHHRSEVDFYLSKAEQDKVETRGKIEQENNPTGIRARLIAKRSAENA